MQSHHIVAALLRREFSRASLLALPVIVAAWWACAGLAASLRAAEGPDFTGRLLRRADLTLLGICALLAALRVAERMADDRARGWTEPWAAAGGDRRIYAPVLVLVVTLAGWVWFAAGASAFALGVAQRDGVTELLHSLPELLAAGFLLILCITAYTSLFALVVRDALAAIAAAAIMLAAPVVLLLAHHQISNGAPPPLWLSWGGLYAPDLFAADSRYAFAVQVLYATVALLAGAALSLRFTARRV